jgi:hypothetical protein
MDAVTNSRRSPAANAPLVGLERLEAIAASIPDRSLAKWLRDSLSAYRCHGVPIDRALQLKPAAGQRDPRTSAALAKRDLLLGELRNRFWPKESHSRYAAAREITSALCLYFATAWTRAECDLDEPPPHRRGTVQEFCWLILHERPRVPSAPHIYRMLRTSELYSCAEESATFTEHNQQRVLLCRSGAILKKGC